MMINLFRPNVEIEPYEYNTDVPFEVAFKALRDGYTIRHGNQHNCYLYMLNGRVYELFNREEPNCFEIQEFSLFDMLIDKWQILKPLDNKFRRRD